MVRQSVDAETRFDVPKLDRLVARCRYQMRRPAAATLMPVVEDASAAPPAASPPAAPADDAADAEVTADNGRGMNRTHEMV